MLKDKLITALRVVFGKKPIIIEKKADITQLGMSDLLLNKTALITGGASGIGLEIAKAMLRAGATVIITGREEKKLEKACNILSECKRDYAEVYYSVIDMSRIDDLSISFAKLLAKIGNRQIDILVNNAGTRGLSKNDFGSAKSEDFDVVINTNLRGTFFLTQIVAKYMKEKSIEGNILNISSSSALRPANSAYILSKWGIRGMTLGMAKALIPFGIVVNGIAPGPTATPMLNMDSNNIHFPQNPLGRLAMPEEIANMAVILTSPLGRTVVGDTLYMTGGAGLITLDDAIYNF